MRFWGNDRINEYDLIAGCIRGEHKMQEELYKAFAPRMFTICLRYAGSYPEAEDMMQEGFIRAFSNLTKFRNEGSFEGWMRRIMVHSSIEYYRKYHKMVQLVDIEDAAGYTSVDAQATSTLAANELMALIQQLAPGYRIVFNLYAIEGYSHREIAEITGISEGASKSQLSRARSVLKEQIVKMEGKRYGYAG